MVLGNLINESMLIDPNRVVSPDAWVGHIPFGASLITVLRPRIFVELGTHTGNSYLAFCQAVVENKLDTKCYAVDTWLGDEHSSYYGEDVFRDLNEYHEQRYTNFSRLMRMTFDDAATYFSDGSIDLLHIDGLHTYEAVKHDFETWLPKVSERGVILFHDINVRERGFGVWKLWEELKERYPSMEFGHSYGLGVLFCGKSLHTAPLVSQGSGGEAPTPFPLKRLFAHLGQGILNQYEISSLKTAVADREAQISTLNQAVAERDAQVSARNQAVAEREAQVSTLNQAVTERDGQIAALYNSTSWRITRPLRIVAHQMKRVRRVAELAMPAIKRGGGLKNTFKKAIQLYRREGLAGIRRGFRTVATSGQTIPTLGSGEYDRNDYTEWIRRYDTLTDKTRAAMHARIDAFPHKPLISVVMPTYNPKPEWLIEAIESVRRQIYPYWELCIADDASTDKAIRPILERYSKEDSRIKVVFREQNGHISAASNSALELATGEWVALLDHDDLLSEHALFWVADAIHQDPDVRLIYSDEDKIAASGRRFDPYFKCDWNVDLFYSHNLITHLGVYRADLLNTIGGFREGFEGAQDYDLALRCIERIESKQIHHIPSVLYHWRMHVESTAHSGDAKPYAVLAGERALNEHFQRQGVNAITSLLDFGMYRIRYALPDTLPLVSLIIPTRNGLQLIRKCVESILKKTTYPNYEILIVDNGSDDPATLQYFDELQADARVRVMRDDRPFNHSALNNAAVKLAQGEVLGLLNNDIEVISPDWLSEMVSHALRPGVGAVGARLWYLNNTLQHGGAVLGVGGVTGHSHKHLGHQQYGYFGRASLIQSFSAVTAACLVIRKTIFEEVGGLNETDLQIAFNDIDFCLRVREAGYRNIWTPYAELYHHESASRGFEDTPKKRDRFAKEVRYMKQRWGEQLLNDPAYSPNLTLDHEDFSLAWPPRVELLAPPGARPQQTQLSRIDKALIMVDRKGLGLEIGPSHNPLAPKRQGFNVHILDHASAEELRTKYKGHGVNLENIEEVDFVWRGEPLHELVGREQGYDWIIASHVIEHTPDLITFLAECERLLKPDGMLSLIIPDKRYCFDYFNAATSTGELLDAFEQKRKQPSPGKVFDHFAGAAKRNGQIAWGQGDAGTIGLVHSFGEACAHWEKATTSRDYIDVHNWRFTPNSFRLILADLQMLGLTGLGLAKEFDTEGCEFFVALRKTSATVAPDRLELLNRVRVDG
jgi:glycosyltransferase involved in cell wall biosynthesis